MEAGVDSLGAVELRNLIQDKLGDGVSVPSTLLLDYPTARRLANFLSSSQEYEESEFLQETFQSDRLRGPGVEAAVEG
eukprot:5927853-Prymnesium_polylepis.1